MTLTRNSLAAMIAAIEKKTTKEKQPASPSPEPDTPADWSSPNTVDTPTRRTPKAKPKPSPKPSRNRLTEPDRMVVPPGSPIIHPLWPEALKCMRERVASRCENCTKQTTKYFAIEWKEPVARFWNNHPVIGPHLERFCSSRCLGESHGPRSKLVVTELTQAIAKEMVPSEGGEA